MRVMQITGKRSVSDEGNPPISTSYLHRVAYSVRVSRGLADLRERLLAKGMRP
jgi:hypothetical protein